LRVVNGGARGGDIGVGGLCLRGGVVEILLADGVGLDQLGEAVRLRLCGDEAGLGAGE
jgi:hypothetical protein